MASLASLPRPTTTYHTKPYDRITKSSGFIGAGKTILITGGASGVGYSFSKVFAEAGAARIAILARSADALQKAKHDLEAAYPSTQILTYQTSVTEYARVAEIVQELGTIDVLVLNAAVAHRRAQATELSVQEMQDAFETNVIAAWSLAKAYLVSPPPAAGRKTIINVSAAAIHLPGSYRVGYGSSKCAGVQVMQNFAAQYQGDDVGIFSIHPGSFYTPGVAQNMPKGAIEWEEPDLPAYFALWLAGPESAFLHGRFVWANWDVDELLALKERVVQDPSFLTIGLVR